MGGIHRHLASHLWVPNAPAASEFREIFQSASDSCIRELSDVGPGVDHTKRVCYVHQEQEAGRGGLGRGWDDWRPESQGEEIRLGLWDVNDPGSIKPLQESDGSSFGVESEVDAVAAGMRLGFAGLARHCARSPPGGGEPPLTTERAKALLIDADPVRDDMPSFLAKIFGLWDVRPATPSAGFRGLLTLITRRNKRIILNEPELLSVAQAHGLATEVAALEDMRLYAQLRLLRRTNVLVGIHGSGLINVNHMLPGTALVELFPFNVTPKLRQTQTLFATAAALRTVTYVKWMNGDRANTIFHWHFLGDDFAE